MDLLKELLVIVFQVGTIMPLLFAVTFFMGKRSLGELPVFDFLAVITLGSVVGTDIADPQIKHLHSAMAIIAIAGLQIAVSKMLIKNRKLGRLLTFEPTVVIHNGGFLVKNLRRIRYSTDNILEMLREKGIFDIQDVDLAIVESNGKLTVHRKPHKETVTAEDLGIVKVSSGIALPVILEGKVSHEILRYFGLDSAWLAQQLKSKGINNVNDVFFASVNSKKELHVSMARDAGSAVPPLRH